MSADSTASMPQDRRGTMDSMANWTVKEVIQRFPETVAVFHRYGIDACCGGMLPVFDAAARHGVDVAVLIAELKRSIEAGQ